MYYARFKDPETVDLPPAIERISKATVLQARQAEKLVNAMSNAGALVDLRMALSLASELGEQVLLTEDLPVFVHTLRDKVEAVDGFLDVADAEQKNESDLIGILESFKPVGLPH